MALIVSALAGAGLNCLASKLIEGTAIATRISTGINVQTTSMVVLWLVFDGTGLALLAEPHHHIEQQAQHEHRDHH